MIQRLKTRELSNSTRARPQTKRSTADRASNNGHESISKSIARSIPRSFNTSPVIPEPPPCDACIASHDKIQRSQCMGLCSTEVSWKTSMGILMARKRLAKQMGGRLESDCFPEYSRKQSYVGVYIEDLKQTNNLEIKAEKYRPEESRFSCSAINWVTQFYNRVSLWLAEYVVGTMWFEKLFLTLILLNTVMIILKDSLPDSIFMFSETVFVILFCIEIVLKLLGFGLRGFFKDGWNTFDFIIVASGLAFLFFPKLKNIGPLRSLRVIRPLRTIRRLPGLRVIINSLMSSFASMADVALLLIFLMTAFAILGLHLWNGVLHRHCFNSQFPNKKIDLQVFCSNQSDFGGNICSRPEICISDSSSSNPANGLIGFDNFGTALLTVFVISTQEDWAPIMYGIRDAWGYCWYFFVVVIILNSFFALSLTVGVMLDEISEAAMEIEAEIAREIEIQKRKNKVQLGEHIYRIKKNSQCLPKNDSKAIGLVQKAFNRSKLDVTLTAAGSREDFLKLKELERKSKHTRIANERKVSEQIIIRKHDHLAFAADHTIKDLVAEKAEREREEAQEEKERIKNLIIEVCGQMKTDILSQQEYFKKYPPFMKIYLFVEAKPFDFFITTSIFINTAVLALDHHGLPEIYVSPQEFINFTFTVIFFIEMLLKLLANGPSRYFKDPFNSFDASIVVLSIVDIVMAISAVRGRGTSGVSAFRAFRILRTFKLVNKWPSIQALLRTIQRSLVRIGYVSMLIALFLLVFGTTGVQLFSGMKMYRSRFDTLWWSMITMFQLLTGDEWIYIMGEAFDAQGWVGGCFIFLVYLCGGFVGVNMFVAIILLGFDEDDKELERSKIVKRVREAESLKWEEEIKKKEPFKIGPLAKEIVEWYEEEKKREKEKLKQRMISLKQEGKKVARLEGEALNCIKKNNPARIKIFKFVTHRRFEPVMFIIILASCVSLAFEGPGTSGPNAIILNFLNYIWTLIFSIELILKVLAFGFYHGKYAYLSDNWNKLDASIVLFSWLSLVSSYKSLAALRALRPLRMITRLPNVKIVVNSLFDAIPGIINVVFFGMLLFLVFGILFVGLFKGQFNYCDCPDEDLKSCTKLNEDECIGDMTWTRPPVHFDHIGAAMMSLMEVATFTGWAEVMYTATDTNGVGKGRILNNKQWVPVLFVLLIVVCGFFLLNLFLGVIVDTFFRLKNEYDGSAFLTEEQRDRRAVLRMIRATRLRGKGLPPEKGPKAICYKIANNNYFSYLVVLVIILNTFTLASYSWTAKKHWKTYVVICNSIFLIFFVLEIAIRIFGIGFKRYWEDNWNRFDLVVTICSAFGEFGPWDLSVLSLGRVFRLIGQLPTLHRLFDTFADTLPLMANIGTLVMCVMYIYGIVGMNLFGHIPLSETHSKLVLSRHVNFQSFTKSQMTLFRIITGDDWHEIRWATTTQMEGMAWAANIYFASFLVIATLVMMELYTAVVLENFSQKGGGKEAVLLKMIQEWAETWGKIDYDNHGIMSVRDFFKVMKMTSKPFGFGPKATPFTILNMLRFSNLRCRKVKNPYSKNPNPIWCVEYRQTLIKLSAFVGMEIPIIVLRDEAKCVDNVLCSTVYMWYAVNFIQDRFVRSREWDLYNIRRWFAIRQIQITWRLNQELLSPVRINV